MTKEEARFFLEGWISSKTQDRLGEHIEMRLPIKDETVLTRTVLTPNGQVIESWTFIGLIKISYEL